MKTIHIIYTYKADEKKRRMSWGTQPIIVRDDYNIEELIKESEAHSVAICDYDITFFNGGLGKIARRHYGSPLMQGFLDTKCNYLLQGISLKQLTDFFDKIRKYQNEQRK